MNTAKKTESPFDLWWKLYKAHCHRMSRKPTCTKKFNALSLDTQRAIYQDILDRLKYYQDWQEKNVNGKRQMMCGPEVYLNSYMWLDPVDKPKRQDNVRDTTKESINALQQLHSLNQFKAQLIKNGQDTSAIDRQIEALK